MLLKEKIEDIRKEINNAIITCNFKDNNDFINLEIIIDNFNIKAYQRNRSGNGHSYDPLSTYKKIFKLKLDPLIEQYIKNPLLGYCYIEIDKYIKLPKDSNKLQKEKAKEKLYLPTIKPDNDNIEKILFDILNDKIYKDDSQIVENRTRKYYDEIPRTEIRVKIYKNKEEFKVRRGK